MSQPTPTTQGLTRKGRETRARIVDAAAQLIFETGAAHTTIEDVRTAAKVSSSQLYHYFKDKPALVRAVIEHQAATIITTQQQFDLSSLEGLREWRDFVVAHARETDCRGGCPIGSLGGELAETEPRARADVAAGFDRWKTTIQTGLRKMHTLGRLAPQARPDQLALATLTALQGGLLLAQIKRDPEPLEAALDAMLALIATQSVDNPPHTEPDEARFEPDRIPPFGHRPEAEQHA